MRKLDKGLISPLVTYKNKEGMTFVYETKFWISFWKSGNVPKAN